MTIESSGGAGERPDEGEIERALGPGLEILARREAKVVYRQGGEVLKVFGDGHPLSDILNEALNQARVMETGLDIPRILEVGKIAGRWSIRMERVEGPTLEREMAERPGDRAELLGLLVDVQIGVHLRRGGLLNMLAEKIRRKLDQADLDEATRYELHTRLESMPRGNRLCHGDLVPANVVLRPGGSIAVLDWSHAAQGDPAADAAQTSLLWRLAGSDETAGAYLELFSDRSGIARRSVEAWMPLVAAAQSPRCRGRERRTLLDWAQVVDYV